jgi:hypothetical protein
MSLRAHSHAAFDGEADGVRLAADRPSTVRLVAPELVAAVVTWTLLCLLEHCAPATPGEPLVLRWARTASEHPLRMSLAAAIAVYGLFGSGRACRVGPSDEGARKKP